MAKQKPYVDVAVKCPHCSAEMRVQVYRKKTSPENPPPEYDYTTNIQLQLPGVPVLSEEE